MGHKAIIAVLIVLILTTIFIGIYKYLINPYSIYDDQREIIEHVKLYDNLIYDKYFYSSPLYFIIYTGINQILSNLLIIKLLFLITVPIFVIYSYNIGRIIIKRNGSENLYLPAVFTIILTVFYLDTLIGGLHKSVSFPIFLAAIYYTIVDKKLLALLSLIVVAVIYPPYFIIGITFSVFYLFYESYIQLEIKRLPEIFNNLKRLNLARIIPFLLVLVMYVGYYFIVDLTYFRNPAKNALSATVAEKLEIDTKIEEEINKTRTDFIPSEGRYLRILPKHYLNDIRMGVFGEIGGINLWIFLIATLVIMYISSRKYFIIPNFIFILFFTSAFLYFLSHIFYDKMYYPNRYTKFTLPIIAICLLSINLHLSVNNIMQKLYSISKKYKYLFSFISIFIAFVLFYLSIYRKKIYLGSQYDNFDFTIFMIAISSLLIFAGLLIGTLNIRNLTLRKYDNFIIAGVYLLLFILIFSSMGETSSTVKIYDKKLFPILENLGDNISLCGYPEMMNTIHPFTTNLVIVNLGQSTNHEDAYELYHLLTAYYSTTINGVYKYMSIKNYDFFIVQKEYFYFKFTENNNLFSFYPVLRSYEEKLKKENDTKFALLNPPQEIIEFENQKSIVISYQKLKNYILS